MTWPTNDRLFIADKTGTARKKWDGAGFAAANLTAWGLAVPPAALADMKEAAGGGLTLLGVYLFKFTYYNSITTEESNPVATSSTKTLTGANQTITFDVPADGAFDVNAADKVRIYRTTDGGTTYYLDQTLAYAGALLDDQPSTQSDLALVAGGTLLATDNDAPVALKVIVSHKNRVFGWGNPANPHILYYSKISGPENWPTANALDTKNPSSTAGPQDIIGGFVQDDQLHLLTADQHLILTGTTADDFKLEWLPHGAGTFSHHTITQWDRFTAWESLSGTCVWDGSSHTFPAKDKLRGLYGWMARDATDWTNAGSPTAIGPAGLSNMTATIQKTPDKFQRVVSFRRRGQTTNDRLLIHDLQRGCFHIRTVAAASLGVVKDSNNVDHIYLGNYGGLTLELDRGFTFNGAAISAFAETKNFDLGPPEKRKSARGLQVSVRSRDASLAAHTVTISWYSDYSTTAAGSRTVAIPAARGVPVFIPISVKGQFIRFRIENTNASQDFAVDAFAVLVRELTIARERVA